MNGLNIPIYPKSQLLRAGQGHTLQYAYRTEQTELDAYLSELISLGFTPRFEREACGNYFATYASDSDYAHIYYVPDTRTVRVISAPLGGLSLPDFIPEDGVDTDFASSVTQPVLDYYYYDPADPASRSDGNFGACYIVTLDDGSLLVYDGGGKWGKNDVERIWSLLKKHGRRNAQNKIVISGWIITHEHVDHFWCMHHVLLDHKDEISLKAIYCTPIERELLLGHSDPSVLYIESPDAMPALRAAVGDFKLIRMHTGQIFYVRNAKIEVLCTPEDIFPELAHRYYDFNDTSAVTRVCAGGRTLLVLGDAYHVCSHNLVSLWGNALKSDYCTLAHHGWGGCTRSLYDHVRPHTVLVPFSRRWIDRILTDETRVRSSGATERWIQWAIDRYGDFHKVTQHVFFDLLESDSSRFLLADLTTKTLDLATGEVSETDEDAFQVGCPYKNT